MEVQKEHMEVQEEVLSKHFVFF